MQFIFYRDLNEDKIVQNVSRLQISFNQKVYDETLGMLLEKSYELNLDKNLFKSYLCHVIIMSENPFSLRAEKGEKTMDKAFCTLVAEDLKKLIALFEGPIIKVELKNEGGNSRLEALYETLEHKPEPLQLVAYLTGYYGAYGAGKMNAYKAFKWDTEVGLMGIAECDPIRLKDLIGCDYQKEVLIKNTQNFLKGKVANNVLLFGDSGTGKSSLVKALLNEYHGVGLRIIDLSKTDFFHFNKISASLRNRGLKFIIFLDDLSFEEFETEYKYMKALIEGGVEIKPSNVLIYATSNRRHLVRETWDERAGQDVHVTDTRQEKLSLADRFGISLTFTSPDQKAYLDIVFELAKDYKLELPQNVLREKAIQWELIHGGRSGRVAKQFIHSLL